MADTQQDTKSWTEHLSEEDLAFIKRFVLASGSLKEMARIYKVTYPTVRLRLDRLIAKIEVLDNAQPMSQFERLIRAAYAEQKLDAGTFKTLLAAHKNEMEAKNETPARDT